MYLLPKTFTGSFLIGRRVEVLSFCRYHFDIYFTDKCWIHIESRCRLYQHGELIEDIAAFPLMETQLLRLLEKIVSDVECVDQSDLIIRMDDIVLEIQGNIGPYEAYRISDGEREFLV